MGYNIMVRILRTALLATSLVTILLSISGCCAPCGSLTGLFTNQGLAKGEPAPDFTLTSLRGEQVTLSELQGQVVLITFWSTTCGPCRRELPTLQELYENYTSQGLRVLAVNVGEKKSTVQRFVDENGYTLPILLDSRGEVRGAYGVRGIPTSYLVDGQGTVQHVQLGYGAGLEAELRAEIESLLAELK